MGGRGAGGLCSSFILWGGVSVGGPCPSPKLQQRRAALWVMSPPYFWAPHGKVKEGPNLGTSAVDLELGPQGYRTPQRLSFCSLGDVPPPHLCQYPLPIPPNPFSLWGSLWAHPVGPSCPDLAASGGPQNHPVGDPASLGEGCLETIFLTAEEGSGPTLGKTGEERSSEKKDLLVTFADFHGVTTHSMANFGIPTGQHNSSKWNNWLLGTAQAGSSMPVGKGLFMTWSV